MEHGHAKAEERHLALHRLAFEKLRADPEGGKHKARELLERWLGMANLEASHLLFRRWQALLDRPVDEIEEEILGDTDHQLIQCSPLGALITPRERFAVYQRLAHQ
jgi:hypothetical protein